jgi:hypothetical protein
VIYRQHVVGPIVVIKELVVPSAKKPGVEHFESPESGSILVHILDTLAVPEALDPFRPVVNPRNHGCSVVQPHQSVLDEVVTHFNQIDFSNRGSDKRATTAGEVLPHKCAPVPMRVVAKLHRVEDIIVPTLELLGR